MQRITVREKIEKMREEMTDLEQRLERLSERAVEQGKLMERKRIADQAMNEYQVAFKTNPTIAAFLDRFLTFILEDYK